MNYTRYNELYKEYIRAMINTNIYTEYHYEVIKKINRILKKYGIKTRYKHKSRTDEEDTPTIVYINDRLRTIGTSDLYYTREQVYMYYMDNNSNETTKNEVLYDVKLELNNLLFHTRY